MKNITLSAPEELIESARKDAQSHGSTLNQEFRAWLAERAEQSDRQRMARFDEITERLRYFKTDRKYTREEMNER